MRLLTDLTEFMVQRELARVGHDAGQPQPWTNNSIINTYRFCNIRREDDKVTRWLKKHWRDPYADHPNLTVAVLLARMINWPPTLEAIGFPEIWNQEYEEHAMLVIGERARRGLKAWTGAYVITTCGVSMDKAVYVVQTVCGACRARGVAPQRDDTLAAFWTRLKSVNGLGAGFLAGQVIADLKYCDPHLKEARDWWEWATPGPGSRRGLNRYMGHTLNDPWGAEWLECLYEMAHDVWPKVSSVFGDNPIHAQDWQNVMCEFDKYMRVKNGEGRPRSRYARSDDYQV